MQGGKIRVNSQYSNGEKVKQKVSVVGHFCRMKDFSSEQVSPKCVSLVCGLFWTEDNQDLSGSTETFAWLDYLKESKLGVFSRVRIITRDKFYQSDPPIWQGRHLVMKGTCPQEGQSLAQWFVKYGLWILVAPKTLSGQNHFM